MESITLCGRVAPIAKSPLDSCRGRRRCYGSIRVPVEEITEKLSEYLRYQSLQTTPKATK